jgi:hypothetical protein
VQQSVNGAEVDDWTASYEGNMEYSSLNIRELLSSLCEKFQIHVLPLPLELNDMLLNQSNPIECSNLVNRNKRWAHVFC